MSKKQIVICDICSQYINSLNYREHVMFQHNLNLPANLDIERKIINDQIRIIEINKQKEINREKKKEHNKSISKMMQLLNNMKTDDPFNDYMDEIKRDREKERELKIEQAKQAKIEKKERDDEVERQTLIQNTHTFHIIWDDIIFDDDFIKINPSNIKTIVKSIFHKGIIKSLNTIKKEYFIRLYSKKVYNLTFIKGDLDYEKSPDWSKLVSTIEFAKEYYIFRYSDFKKEGQTKKFENLTNNQLVLLFENLFLKSNYLKLLASFQSHKFSIIPVIEYSNKNVEESFIFRFISKSEKVITLWENVNESRASHVFVTTKENHNLVLPLIEDFIYTKHFDMKRSLLHENSTTSLELKKKLHFHSSKKHVGLQTYEAELKLLFAE